MGLQIFAKLIFRSCKWRNEWLSHVCTYLEVREGRGAQTGGVSQNLETFFLSSVLKFSIQVLVSSWQHKRMIWWHKNKLEIFYQCTLCSFSFHNQNNIKMHIVLEFNSHMRNVIIKKQNGSLKRHRMTNRDCAEDLTFSGHYSELYKCTVWLHS